jgi:hypothetical protein
MARVMTFIEYLEHRDPSMHAEIINEDLAGIYRRGKEMVGQAWQGTKDFASSFMSELKSQIGEFSADFKSIKGIYDKGELTPKLVTLMREKGLRHRDTLMELGKLGIILGTVGLVAMGGAAGKAHAPTVQHDYDHDGGDHSHDGADHSHDGGIGVLAGKEGIKIAKAIDSKYKLSPEGKAKLKTMKMIKPSEILKKLYGDEDYEKVVRTAAKEQGAQNVHGVEIPALNSPVTTMADKMDDPIPVIFANASDFGVQNAGGFCASLNIDGKLQKFCVVESESEIHTLAHELRHTTQDNRGSGSYLDDNSGKYNVGDLSDLERYSADQNEIGVRIAGMKQTYLDKMKTENPQTYQKLKSNDFKMGDGDTNALIHYFYKNPGKFSYDVQQMKHTLDNAKDLDKLIGVFKDEINKVVDAGQGRGDGLA